MGMYADARVVKGIRLIPMGFVNKYRIQPRAELYIDRENSTLFKRKGRVNIVHIEEKQSGKEFELLKSEYLGMVNDGFIKEL